MEDYSYGIRSVWESDEELQSSLISGIIRQIRGVTDKDLQTLEINYLKKLGAFYVNVGEYLQQHFGEDISEYRHGIFTLLGRCSLAERLAIPLRSLDDTVIGFCGYSKKPDDWPADQMFMKYWYPPKHLFTKGRFMFIEREEFKKALEEQYICIVDGIFDKIVLQCLDINAVSLCGSSLTDWHIKYLSFIKHKVVIADNDAAGRKLFNICKWKLRDVVEITQPYTGDIDSLLRDNVTAYNIKACIAEMKSEGFLFSKSMEGRNEQIISKL